MIRVLGDSEGTSIFTYGVGGHNKSFGGMGGRRGKSRGATYLDKGKCPLLKILPQDEICQEL